MTVTSFFKASYKRLKRKKINNGTESAGSPSPGPSAQQHHAGYAHSTQRSRSSRSNRVTSGESKEVRLSQPQVHFQKAKVVFLINSALSGDLHITKWCL